MDNYVVHRKLGRGKYSHVFEGTDKRTKKSVAIKVLVPIRKDKIRREYHILSALSHPNIVALHDIVKCSHLKTTSLILDYFPHLDFRQLYPTLTLLDIKHYMAQLFKVPPPLPRASTISTPTASCTATSSPTTSSSTPTPELSR